VLADLDALALVEVSVSGLDVLANLVNAFGVFDVHLDPVLMLGDG
jgi:hypothetical protein